MLLATEIASHGDRAGGRPGPLLFLIVLGLVAFLFVRRQKARRGGGGHGSSPMTHLQQRFATGEIDQAEFEHRRAVLRGDKDVPAPPATMASPQRDDATEAGSDEQD